MCEVFSAMHDSMSHSMDICNALDRINRSVRTSPTKNELDSALSVSNRRGREFLVVTLRLQRDDGFTADSLDGSTRKSLIGIASNGVEIGRDDLKLDRRATTIEDENVHWYAPSVRYASAAIAQLRL